MRQEVIGIPVGEGPPDARFSPPPQGAERPGFARSGVSRGEIRAGEATRRRLHMLSVPRDGEGFWNVSNQDVLRRDAVDVGVADLLTAGSGTHPGRPGQLSTNPPRSLRAKRLRSRKTASYAWHAKASGVKESCRAALGRQREALRGQRRIADPEFLVGVGCC